MDDTTARIVLGHLPDTESFLRVGTRLLTAVILGALIGIQRELVGKPAGLRTHALVTLAAAIFTVVPLEAGMSFDAVSRVIQGVATGIGFIGAGVILKRQEAGEVIGLTTAATVWAATGVGVAIGLGHILMACLSVGLAWLVLAAFTRIDGWVEKRRG